MELPAPIKEEIHSLIGQTFTIPGKVNSLGEQRCPSSGKAFTTPGKSFPRERKPFTRAGKVFARCGKVFSDGKKSFTTSRKADTRRGKDVAMAGEAGTCAGKAVKSAMLFPNQHFALPSICLVSVGRFI